MNSKDLELREFRDAKVITGLVTHPVYKKHVLDIKYVNNDEVGTVYKSEPTLPFANSDVFKANIVHWRSLTNHIDPDENCKVVYEVTFDVKDSNFKFKAGDTIGVIPENRDDEVESILSHLGLETQADLSFRLSVARGQNGKIPAHIPVKSTLRHVLKYCVNLRSVLKKLFLFALSKYTENERERKTVEYLSSTEGAQYYRQYVLNNRGNALRITELFKVFKSCKPPVEVLLSHLPRLLPRPYSIVNSGLKDSDFLKICFSVLPSNLEKGLVTGWLESIILNDDLTNKFRKFGIEDNGIMNIAKVPIYMRKNLAQFSLPENLNNPLVLIAIGTAVSPFIGFLEELEMYKTSNRDVTDDVWLFFGCRDQGLDHIYENELNGFRKRGVLKKLNVAFSYSKVGERHVQDSLENNSMDLSSFIQSNASIFVCGDVELFAKEIKGTLKMCLLKSGKTEEEATKIISEMDIEKRFIVDSWT